MSRSGAEAARIYATAVSVVLGLGAFALAAQLYRRFVAVRARWVLAWYAAVLAVAGTLAGVALSPAAVVGTPGVAGLALAVPVGALAGAAARGADRAVLRAAARRPRPGRATGAGAAARRPRAVPEVERVAPTRGALLLGGRATPDVATERARSRGTPLRLDPRQFPLVAVVAVAVVEEVFYRGAMLEVAARSGRWEVPVVAATVVAFALTHVAFGWRHVLAKAPLGTGATACALALDSVVPAVVAHVWFNVSVWRDVHRAQRVWR